MKKIIILFTALSLLAFVGCTETSESSESSKANETVATTTASTSTTAVTTTVAETEAEKPEYEITFVSSAIGKDYADAPILIVEYQFINNTDKARSFATSIDNKAYQNGVECSSIVVSDEIDSQQQLNDIKPGTPYTLKVGYKLADLTTPVEIECYKLIDFNDDKQPLLTQTINLV